MPKVSVIMGVFNATYRMDNAINSIIEQTFTDWEFIICDDGSSDNTYNKLLEWQQKDSRIIPIRNEKNVELAATLNHCIKNCKGKYIARMDDDDFSYPERFQKQVDFLDEHLEYALVSSLIDLYDGEKIIITRNGKKENPQNEDFLFNSCFVHPATMFRGEALKAVNGYRVAQETTRAQDYDLFMRMYALGYRGYNIQETLFRYFVNPNAMKKRKYKYRFDEAIVRYKGFKLLGLLPKGIPYIIKPLIVGLIHHKVLFKFKMLLKKDI